MSLMVLATGVYCRPRSSTTLLLFMWEADASWPSGSAAASGMAAFKVSVMNLADMELGWLMMYLPQRSPAHTAQQGTARHRDKHPESAAAFSWFKLGVGLAHACTKAAAFQTPWPSECSCSHPGPEREQASFCGSIYGQAN